MRHRVMIFGAMRTAFLLSLIWGLVPVQAQLAGGGSKAAKAKGQLIDALRSQGASRDNLGTPVSANVPVSGVLKQSDSALADGSRYHRWLYPGTAGERVTIAMRSVDFDSYLQVGRYTEGRFVLLGSNDDGGGGRDAQLEIQLPAGGPYVIIANSYGRDAFGTYTLEVTSRSRAASANWADVYPGGGDPNERYALLVGIDDYPGTTDDLTGPVRDAEIMREVLTSKYGFNPQNIVLITDANATREQISNAFLRHLGQAGPNGVAVFYYSGHGTQTQGNLGIQSPLDSEADGKDEAIVVWGSDGHVSYLLDDELGFAIDHISAGRTLIVLDACFSGTATRGPGMRQRASGVQPKRLYLDRTTVHRPAQFLVDSRGRATSAAREAGAPMGRRPVTRGGERTNDPAFSTADILRDPRNHVLLTAASDTEFSYTAGGWPRRGGIASVLTYYLADAMEADDGTATIAAIMDGVRERSHTHTLSFEKGPQTPQVEGVRKNETLASFLAKR